MLLYLVKITKSQRLPYTLSLVYEANLVKTTKNYANFCNQHSKKDKFEAMHNSVTVYRHSKYEQGEPRT